MNQGNDPFIKIAEKLQSETDKENRVPAEPIAGYLLGICVENPAFCKLVMQEHKTIQKCFDYVYNYAKQKLQSNGWLPDQEIYDAAAAYFLIDDAELERQKAETEAKQAAEREKRLAENKQRAEQQRKIQAAEKQKREDEAFGQISLFGEVTQHEENTPQKAAA